MGTVSEIRKDNQILLLHRHSYTSKREWEGGGGELVGRGNGGGGDAVTPLSDN